MTPTAVLEVSMYTPAERARLAVALGWPPDSMRAQEGIAQIM
jgi:hypothetical protein